MAEAVDHKARQDIAVMKVDAAVLAERLISITDTVGRVENKVEIGFKAIGDVHGQLRSDHDKLAGKIDATEIRLNDAIDKKTGAIWKHIWAAAGAVFLLMAASIGVLFRMVVGG